MLNDASGFRHVYLCCGYTDLRKGIDGWISIVTGTFGLDPTKQDPSFCSVDGRRNDRMKALFYDGDGWLLCYKRFTDGKLQWPRSVCPCKAKIRRDYKSFEEGRTPHPVTGGCC
ncbi:hypothetical protein B5F53_11015 [Blautia sp. An249]|uniref:IS66 family insertion sequence element accessory protein TnpB n=1 Tax=Blautia sp. An249 TaxID=1965603 RepID=UPI000B3740DA|nr:IS66 family insertion sequence element accessory protein TnpB [Blautia sp. An249]OUO78455.1 hypothetical protein B5F53_11015 [Blautia sp. An249]